MDFSRTLIIKPSSLGDIVQALPVLTSLREAHPKAHIAWLVATVFADLLQGHSRLDRVVTFDRRRYGSIGKSFGATADFVAFVEGLRREKFTAVIDLQGLFRSGFLTAATGAPSRVGFAAARELAPMFYTLAVPMPRKEMHAVDRYMALARHIGLMDPQATDHLPISPEARETVRQRLRAEGLAPGDAMVVVSPHARWPTKQWPPERFAEVVRRLHEQSGTRAVLIGSSAAATIAREIAAAAASARPVDLVNRTTLREMVALVSEARAMVTNDSGPMHVAATIGTPVVAIFGPTSAERTGPYGPGHRVLTAGAPCRPCFRRKCLYSSGPEALACLTGVAAEEVARHLLEILRSPRRTADNR
jgi:lipopolysaccharide heptosyltransferase I